MSAGTFTTSIYQRDDGTFAPIKVQPETIIPGTNPAGAGPLTAGATYVKVSGSRRGYGVHARTVSITWTGTVPDGYKTGGIIRLPVLTTAGYNALSGGQTFTYLGNEVKVVGKSPERVR